MLSADAFGCLATCIVLDEGALFFRSTDFGDDKTVCTHQTNGEVYLFCFRRWYRLAQVPA